MEDEGTVAVEVVVVIVDWVVAGTVGCVAAPVGTGFTAVGLSGFLQASRSADIVLTILYANYNSNVIKKNIWFICRVSWVLEMQRRQTQETDNSSQILQSMENAHPYYKTQM